MNIRRMLFIVLPVLFILNNAVSFFIFHSGRAVQQSYNVMLDRVLLYKQMAGQTQDNLRAMNVYLVDRSEDSRLAFLHQREDLQGLQQKLAIQSTLPATDLIFQSYTHMIDTFITQEASVIQAANSPDALAYTSFYEEAEHTATFIQEEGYQLIDLELSYYQPLYRQILIHTEGMNRWGVVIFILNTLISIVLAYRISLGISRPIRQLVHVAQQMSDGNLDAPLPQMSAYPEFGVLERAFVQMQEHLKALIVKETEGLEKDKQLKEMELEVLQNQMNPHFLFNSLNVLSKLALLEGAEQTSDLTVTMSNLLRYNLRKLDRPVRLKDEVEHAKQYFTIQQARFRNRIQFVTEIDESGLDVSVPMLTLQPILENVFVHGIEGMEAGAVIQLKITSGKGETLVAISDNGVGMSEKVRASLLDFDADPQHEPSQGQSTGLGTRNVFKRLALFYGKKDLVQIQSNPGQGTTVYLRLPAEGKEERDVPTTHRR
ncbi:two-component sensor histidine kinase [Paenibacillus pectinilyticus]|uniref:histidine kinase n=1 Tax=Paenibacillus pectinilyticus TaxID=512399 RepID=A0A1C1A6Y9_9BACL|nr:histidine kinase [Paenibacillus pectinilyticus]OCT16324.1 two-component sensor histidine kinase [Paenibacillus pectinilyticus]